MRSWIGLVLLVIMSCSEIKQQHWTFSLPEDARWVITPSQGTSLQQLGQESYMRLLNPVSSVPLIALDFIQKKISNNLVLKAVAMVRSTSTRNTTLWIFETNEALREWAPLFYEPLTQNNYRFGKVVIHRLLTPYGSLYAANLHDYWIISAYSGVVERSLAAYMGNDYVSSNFSDSGLEEQGKNSRRASMDAPLISADRIKPAEQWVMLQNLDEWVEQLFQIRYRPSIQGATDGLSAVKIQGVLNENGDGFELRAQLSQSDSATSTLVRSLTHSNHSIELDRYIASNAAGFAIMHYPLRLSLNTKDVASSSLDSLLLSEPELYRGLALSTDEEFGVVSYAESGVAATGEFLFMRLLQTPEIVQQQFEQWAEQGMVRKVDQSYYVQSDLIAELFGGGLSTFDNFYVNFSGDAIILATRKGLVETVEADRRRRQVMYYENHYRELLDNGWENRSAIIWFSSKDFNQFLAPMLMPDAPLEALLQGFDGAMMQMQRIPQSYRTRFVLNTFTLEGQEQPYEELWVWPLSADSLVSTPIAVDVVGSSTQEVLATTVNGTVIAVAFDGTEVFRVQTGMDIPVGSPLVYDWYGNGQKIIMQAAGTKIYAWNTNGLLLPQFPIEVGEEITTPLLVTDVLRNGIPELVIGTAARSVHVLDGRGQNVRGWPQKVNASVRSTILHTQWDGDWALVAHAENSVHSWNSEGEVKEGYPIFFPAPLLSDPFVYDDQWRGTGADGVFYGFDTKPIWSDSSRQILQLQQDSLKIQGIPVSTAPLLSLSHYPSVLLRDSTGFFRKDIYAMVSESGSVFLYTDEANLIANFAMGQSATSHSNLHIIDMDGDNNLDIGLAGNFGRLFAWTIITQERLFDLPTASIRYPIFVDLNGDGQQELVALTRDGLRCWTVNQAQ